MLRVEGELIFFKMVPSTGACDALRHDGPESFCDRKAFVVHPLIASDASQISFNNAAEIHTRFLTTFVFSPCSETPRSFAKDASEPLMSTSCASSCTTVSRAGLSHQGTALDRMKAAAAMAKEQGRANCNSGALTEAALLRHERRMAITSTKAFPARPFYSVHGLHVSAPVP